MAAFTQADLHYVAELARLDLAPDLEAALTEDFQKILGYVEQLQGLDTEGVEPMMHAMRMSNVLREDAVNQWLTRDQVLANAPSHDDEYFLVPKILDTSE